MEVSCFTLLNNCDRKNYEEYRLGNAVNALEKAKKKYVLSSDNDNHASEYRLDREVKKLL